MKNSIKIDDVWLKSSVLGSLWASSEIILGSFIHNLRVPFSGFFLTGIGIIILISISYLWKEKGLFWRSGIICAIMKTMSPSAVIFGPMIAIIAEAFLFEFSTRVFGRNYFGFILGASLAMLWTLFQKIINLIIFYGFNIVKLYENLLVYTQKQLNIQFEIVWLPIILFALIGIILGVTASIIGIKSGMNAIKYRNNLLFADKNNYKIDRKNTDNLKYSISLLIFNTLSISILLILMNFVVWYIWVCFGSILLTFWIIRYKQALKQFKKPKFWMFFILITIFSALVFSKLIDNSTSLLSGLYIGLEMNFRATVMILGFSVIGTELYNPKIRDYFAKSYFKKLHQSVEIAFDTLPIVISNMPNFKHFFREKYSITNHIINQAEYQFNKIRNNFSENPEVIIISGKNNEGKTTFLQKIIKELTEKNLKICGFLSLKIIENKEFIGYNLLNIKTLEEYKLARLTDFENSIPFRKYFFDKNTLEIGNQILKSINFDECDIIVIDEVGIWETENSGWFEGFTNLLSRQYKKIIITVRTEFKNLVIDKFQIRNIKVYDVQSIDIQNIIQNINL